MDMSFYISHIPRGYANRVYNEYGSDIGLQYAPQTFISEEDSISFFSTCCKDNSLPPAQYRLLVRMMSWKYFVILLL